MKIIVPLRPSSTAELEILLKQITSKVDIVEIWLDQLVQALMMNPGLIPQVQTLLQKTKTKHNVQYLGVCKTPAEQGSFAGNPAQRIQVLQHFLELGGDYVDLDVSQNPAQLISQIPSDKLWLSFHDFTWANQDIINLRYQAMQAFKPVLCKFAVTPENELDLQGFINFAKEFKGEAIFTTMGALGGEGREQLKPYTWGAFYALSPEQTTASGQPSLADL